MSGKVQIKTTSRDTNHAAGQIIIKADAIQMADDATLNTMTFGKGKGRKVFIEAETLTMQDEAWIISSSFDKGQSGLINIKVDSLNLSDKSVIAATAFSQGQGGNIILSSNELSINDKAVVTSGTEGQGHGGNIFIVLPANYKMTTAEADSISTASEAKKVVTNEIANFIDLAKQLGGKVDDSIFVGGGKSGNVYITEREQFIDIIVAASADTSRLLVTNCVESEQNESHFVVADYLSDANIEDMLEKPQPYSFQAGLKKSGNLSN